MSTINSVHPVTFLSDDFSELALFLDKADYDKLFVLVDENTLQHCWPLLATKVEAMADAEILEIESGEENKSLEIASQLWLSLAELEAGRKSLFINLGGGVIGDLGGFVASVYKRGLQFIHIPTSLLAQVDAALGGKTGVDFANLKNHLGLFSFPEQVFISGAFLDTLPERHLLNGFAETLKHGLIADAKYWDELSGLDELRLDELNTLVKRSIEIKLEVVEKDSHESGLRKALNFGHTFGHALESYYLPHKTQALYHGEAVAIGMLLEAYLAHIKCGLSEGELEKIKTVITSHFNIQLPSEQDFDQLWLLMKQDKKNAGGQVLFALLSNIGKAKIDVNCTKEELLEAFRYVKGLTLQGVR